jgi:hypothetical protein
MCGSRVWTAQVCVSSRIPPPPRCECTQVFNVPGRCFPVDIIHSQADHMQDYAAAAIDTALQIHLQQPEGETHRSDTHTEHNPLGLFLLVGAWSKQC